MKEIMNCMAANRPSFQPLRDFSLSAVTLLGDYEVNAFRKEVAYLKSLDADRLLKGFCEIGNVESPATVYGGWEDSAIRGHTLGHYLSALSQGYAACGDVQLLASCTHIVSTLAQCQNPKTGYLAAIPESHYDKIEAGDATGTWVPWYTMHKVLSGLLKAYQFTDNAQALEVASKLGDWVYSHTSKWDAATQTKVLHVEYGGMNDVLYQLYGFSGSKKHLSAAHSFDESSLFDPLYRGEDILNGKHANTTIPKIMGALQRYMVLGDREEYYLQVAKNFWDIVVSNHTYITGGNSEWEHFGQAGILDAERTNCNCETCNTYNMLKLTRELFKITGNRKYADYYENTYINAILSSQNPQTGMTTYFQPMATGYFKVYSSPTEHFWCCTGSGMESFTKLGDSIYYHDDAAIYISRYTSSRVTWAEKGLTLEVATDLPLTDRVTITVSTINCVDANIVLRVPDWCAGTMAVTVNGNAVDCPIHNGFLTLSGPFGNGDVIALTIPMDVVAHTLPDNPNAVAFKFGPLVLSANLGNRDMNTTVTGVNVTIPMSCGDICDTVTVKNGNTAQWLKNAASNLVRKANTLDFTLHNTEEALVFSPHYLQYRNRYGIYFKLAETETK